VVEWYTACQVAVHFFKGAVASQRATSRECPLAGRRRIHASYIEYYDDEIASTKDAMRSQVAHKERGHGAECRVGERSCRGGAASARASGRRGQQDRAERGHGADSRVAERPRRGGAASVFRVARVCSPGLCRLGHASRFSVAPLHLPGCACPARFVRSMALDHHAWHITEDHRQRSRGDVVVARMSQRSIDQPPLWVAAGQGLAEPPRQGCVEHLLLPRSPRSPS
jgi:hypothetical protein